MNENTYILTSNGELYHWGVKGMKWGIRRYQNKDGSLTAAGRNRIVKDSDMLFYDYRRKERKLKAPTTNRKNVRDDETLKQAKEEYRKVAVQEKERLLKERTTLLKAGYKFVKNPDRDTRENNNDTLVYVMSKMPAIKEAQKAYTKVEVDLFGNALLADLRLKNTEKTKEFVTESLIANNVFVRTSLGLNDRGED